MNALTQLKNKLVAIWIDVKTKVVSSDRDLLKKAGLVLFATGALMIALVLIFC